MWIPFSIVAAILTNADKTQMLIGVRNIGLAMSKQFGGGAANEAFKRTMFDAQNMNIIFSKSTTSGKGICSTNYISNPPAVQSSTVCDSNNIFSQYTAVHELGHTFEGRTGVTSPLNHPNYDDLINHPPPADVIFDFGNPRTTGTPTEPAVVFGNRLDPNSGFPDWVRGARGWGSAAATPPAVACSFQQDPYTVQDWLVTPEGIEEQNEIHEASADMFLNWVYTTLNIGGFKNTNWAALHSCTATGTPQPTERPGDIRNYFMGTNIPTLATYMPTPTPTATP